MSIEHDAGKGRQFETASSSGVLESDEQLARRLHEELNALTRHARRGPAPAPASQQQQHLQRSKSEKLLEGKVSKASSKQRVQSDAEAQLGSMQQHGDKGDKQPARKRSMLNRELAMLVTDMVDSQLKTATGPRQTKSKDEQVVDQHKGSEVQQLHGIEQLLPILKHESSSSQSEQERLALEHVQAAVADGTPQAKQAQQRQHFMARASDSGVDAAADSACISGAESSGRDSSSSSGEPDHGQHTSPAPDQRRQQDREQPRSRQPQQQEVQQQQPQAQAQGKAKQQIVAGAKVIKIPKLPMVEYAKKWYRAKVLKDAGSKVLLEYQGYSHEGGPFWLAKDHPRIWRGSYKGRDWKYLGDGAWEPKAGKSEGKSRRSKTHRSSSAAAATATAAGDGAAAADSDTEQLGGRQARRQVQQQKHKKQKQPHRRAAAAAAAGGLKQEGEGRADGAVSERDTTSADQQGDAAADEADAAGPSAAELGEVDSGMQLDEPCKQEQQEEEGEEQLDQQVHGAALAEAVAMDVDQQECQAEVAQQQGAEALHEDDKQQVQMQQLQADEQPDVPSTEQCNQAALIRSASSRAAEAADAAAAAVKAELEEAAVADAAAAAAAPVASLEPLAALAAVVQAPADLGKPAAAKTKVGTAPLLLPHTHEEMVAAAAAAVAVAAPPAPRGRNARSARSNSARSNGEGVSEGSSKRGGRGGRGGRGSAAAAAAQAAAAVAAAAAAAAAVKAQQAKQELEQQQQQQEAQQVQQPAASGSASGSGQLPANLRVEPGRALKHSGSSEGPLSPTSPEGGSPKLNSRRRKGVPRRARLDSEDLQRPTKRVRGAPKPSAYCETAMEWQQHEQQVQRQHMLEQQRQQAQLAAQQQQAAWKAAAKSGYGSGSSSSAKKSMWSMQQQGDFTGSVREARQQNCWQQEQQQQQFWGQPSPRQQTLAAAAAAAAAAECQAAVAVQQQQQLKMQGSEPEDVEAACVLLGAAMGRAHSGEVTGLVDSQQVSGLALSLAQRSFSMTAADEMQLSPRFAGVGRQGARRRGHNWSKPLSNNSRPPRPPAQAAGSQGISTGVRHSLNGSLPQSTRRISFSNAELGLAPGLEHEQHSYGALGSAALASAGDAAAVLLGRQSSGVLSTGLGKGRNGSCDSNGKQETLRTLLDAVGQVQSSSGRPDLMFPLQFGGVPMGTQAPGKNGMVQPLQLLHTPVSATAATLLAAVPSLDAVQRMAVLQGQGGVLACLTGESPSLFL